MEIKDFIHTALVQIDESLEDSSKVTGKKTFLTNTSIRSVGKGNYGLIDFDLAVVSEKTNEKNNKGGLRISVLEAGLERNSQSNSSVTSRIHFTVQVGR